MTKRPAPRGSSLFVRGLRVLGDRFSQAPSVGMAAQLPVVTGVLVVTAISLVVGSGMVYRAQLNLVGHTYEVQRNLAVALLAIQDSQVNQRGYLVSGDETQLAQSKLTQAEAKKVLSTLAVLTVDNPVQKASLAALRTLEDKSMAIVSETIRLRHAGQFDAALLMASRDGEVAEAAIRTRVVEMQLQETGLLQNRIGSAATTSYILLAAICATILLAALSLLFWFRDRTTSAGARDRAIISSDKVVRELKTSRDEIAVEIAGREGAEDQVRQMQKMEAVGQLTGGIAHDFNNMLAVIMSAISLSRRRLASGSGDIGPFLDAAMDAASRAASLTARLLAFSRQQPLRPESLDASKFVAGMADLLRRTLGETIRLQTVGAGALWRAHADASQLENAILNLAVNARDAMPDGGMLTIETANVSLDDAYARATPGVLAGQYVMVAVTDSGAGMPAAVIERAFDPFFTTKPVGGGTGLGLSQVFGFVKQSGGHVKIYSEIGQGTTVKIYLPRYFGPEVEARPAHDAAARVPAGAVCEIVLVVEDEARLRELTVAGLRELGYTVLEAASGVEALRVLDDNPLIGCMFTDIVMPNMSGRQLSDEALRRRPALKVLYTTGYTRNAIVHNGMLDPGVNFIAKPFTLENLAHKMREVLGEPASIPL